MPKPTATGAEDPIRVDFAACWRLDRTHWYRYRVPAQQVLLVERGHLRAEAEGRAWIAGPGDLLWLRREPVNAYGCDGAVSYWETHLQSGSGSPIRIAGEPPPPLVRLGEHGAAARQAMETLCLEIDRPGDAARLRVLAAAYGLLAAVASALGRTPVRTPPDPWDRLRDRLEAHLDRPLALADLARDLGVSSDHLIRSFRRRHGLSPMAWRAQARIRRACMLLGDRVGVQEVAHRCGFRDASAFARAFRRSIGLAPSEYAVAGGPVPAVTGERPYPMNRHLRPPGSDGPWFTWA